MAITDKVATERRNLSPAALYEHAIRRDEAAVVSTGALTAETGRHTGRSPKDKFFVKEPSSQDAIWWHPGNQPMGSEPDFTVISLPSFKADPARDGTHSETFILVNLGRRIVLIGGTGYAGEIKKSIFTALNYLLPAQSVFPMHCSANTDVDGSDVALFFGLSGTGKTTLSADPSRRLIGDDEHGWS